MRTGDPKEPCFTWIVMAHASACFSAVILAHLKARAVQAYSGSRSSNAIPALTNHHPLSAGIEWELVPMTCWAVVRDGRRRTGRRRIFDPMVTLTTELLTERANHDKRAWRPAPPIKPGHQRAIPRPRVLETSGAEATPAWATTVSKYREFFHWVGLRLGNEGSADPGS